MLKAWYDINLFDGPGITTAATWAIIMTQILVFSVQLYPGNGTVHSSVSVFVTFYFRISGLSFSIEG